MHASFLLQSPPVPLRFKLPDHLVTLKHGLNPRGSDVESKFEACLFVAGCAGPVDADNGALPTVLASLLCLTGKGGCVRASERHSGRQTPHSRPAVAFAFKDTGA